ncbi:MAG: class I SAM-dependent methyltransferase [Deltaproteobacteria bacterium]|nr:class I SAM-dependent methyltransferase [Deltaproteobacteria bacterium]
MKLARRLTLLALLVLPLATPAGADEEDAGATLKQRLSAGDRTEADKQRDAGRKPSLVLAFVGVEPGMTVVDLIAAGGYYTEVLAVAVGSKGQVYAQNPPRVLQYREGANDKAMTKRLEGNRLPNVKRLDQSLGAVELAPGSVDLAFTALNFHDIYNTSGSEVAQSFLKQVSALLKSGGVLVLIDHSGGAENDNAKLHRIEEVKVLEAVERAGFEVVATSDLLRNPADDRSLGVFDPAIRGRTDRFLLKLRKP